MTKKLRSSDWLKTSPFLPVIKHMQKFQHAQWPRTRQFVGETGKIASMIAFLDVSCNGYCDQLKHNRARIQTLNHSWRGFKSLEQVLEEKAWLLRQQGKGKRLNWWSMTINEKEKWKMTKKQKKETRNERNNKEKRVIFSLVYYLLVIMIFPVQFEINQYS